MTANMRITAIAPWFGGKRNLAPEIVREVGPHRIWWELCFGSLAVTLIKPPVVMETIVDLHGDVTNLARVIQNPTLGPKLYRQLRRTLMSEQLHREAAERYHAKGYGSEANGDALNLDQAYDYFICAWLGRNGTAGTQSYNQGFCVRYTANGGHAAKRWDSAVRSIPAWRKRMANLTILNRNIFDVLPRIPDEAGTAIYCDPPYLLPTRNTGKAYGGSSKYVFDFEASDHEHLAELLGQFRHARVVVSYYDHPSLSELYPGWTQRKIIVNKAMAVQGQRGGKAKKAVEVLLLNGPSYAKPEANKLF